MERELQRLDKFIAANSDYDDVMTVKVIRQFELA